MNSTMKLIDGAVDDPQAMEIERLRSELRAARREADDAQLEADRAREDANRAMSELRRVLSPLYRGLQMVFGELDAAGVTDAGSPSEHAPRASGGGDPRWDSWKEQLGSTAARVIDMLQLHGEMSAQQLASACKMAKVTVYDVMTKKLIKNGLIEKNGGKYSLKKL